MSKQKKKASRNGRAKNTRGPQNAPHFASVAPSSFTEVHKIGLTRLMIAERPNSRMAVELIREWLVVSPEWDRHVTRVLTAFEGRMCAEMLAMFFDDLERCARPDADLEEIRALACDMGVSDFASGALRQACAGA